MTVHSHAIYIARARAVVSRLAHCIVFVLSLTERLFPCALILREPLA